AFGSGPDVDRPWGSGFYSRADYLEILRYAAARHIEVIPEIEMPGHARAAIKSMEANQQYRLNDPDDRSVYTSAQGYHDNVMNPALESTYRFIERVVGELVAMRREAGVPLRHIHMGGDEGPAGVWEGSPAVQVYLKAHNLTSVDDLWFAFYGRVEQILKTQGLLPSGWEEIAVRKTHRAGQPTNIPNPDFAARGWRAYVWNNVPGGGAEDLAYRLANGGYDVVLSPVSNLYFDLAWNENPEETGLDWGGYVDLRRPFDFIPFDYYRNVRVDPSVFVGKDRLPGSGPKAASSTAAWSYRASPCATRPTAASPPCAALRSAVRSRSAGPSASRRSTARAERATRPTSRLSLPSVPPAGGECEAIKIYREFHHVGLKDAKDIIDAMERCLTATTLRRERVNDGARELRRCPRGSRRRVRARLAVVQSPAVLQAVDAAARHGSRRRDGGRKDA